VATPYSLTTLPAETVAQQPADTSLMATTSGYFTPPATTTPQNQSTTPLVVNYPFLPPQRDVAPPQTPSVFRLTLGQPSQTHGQPTYTGDPDLDLSAPGLIRIPQADGTEIVKQPIGQRAIGNYAGGGAQQVISTDTRANWDNLDPSQAQRLPNGDLRYSQQITTQAAQFAVLNRNNHPNLITASPEGTDESVNLERSIKGKQLKIQLSGPASMIQGSSLANFTLDMEAATKNLQPGEVKLLQDFGADGYIVAMGAAGQKAIIGIENLYGGQQINALDGTRNAPATPNKSFVTTMTDGNGNPAFVTIRTDANGRIVETRAANADEIAKAQQGRVQNTDSVITVKNQPAVVEMAEHIVRNAAPIMETIYRQGLLTPPAQASTPRQMFDFTVDTPFEALLTQWQQILGQPFVSLTTLPPVAVQPPATTGASPVINYPFISV